MSDEQCLEQERSNTTGPGPFVDRSLDRTGQPLVSLGVARALWYWIPPLAYAALIFWLSSLSVPPTPLTSLLGFLGDKLAHMAEYGVLGILLYRAVLATVWKPVQRRAVLFAVLAASLYGMSDEIHQAFVPLREAEVGDWVADTIGAAVSVWGLYWFTTSDEVPAVFQNEREVP